MDEEIKQELKELRAMYIELTHQNDLLRKRVSMLEAGKPVKDFRMSAERFLGFTLSNNRGYYSLVRTIDGEQISVYVGKNTTEENMIKKIVKHLSENRYIRESFKQCKELLEIPEIAKILGMKKKEEVVVKEEAIQKEIEQELIKEEQSEDTTSNFIEEKYGFRVVKSTTTRGHERIMARFRSGGVNLNIYISTIEEGYDDKKLREKIVNYFSDIEKGDKLDIYVGKYPEHAKDLGLIT